MFTLECAGLLAILFLWMILFKERKDNSAMLKQRDKGKKNAEIIMVDEDKSTSIVKNLLYYESSTQT